MIIQHATTSDFDRLFLLWQQAGLQLYSKEDELTRYQAMLELNPDLCLLITDKDESAQIHVTNTQVLPFYEKLGFKEMTYVKTYFKDLS